MDEHDRHSARDEADPAATASRLVDMLEAGEGQRVEFKSRLPEREQHVANLLAAMANSGGGTIAVGVDDRGKPVGVEDPAQVKSDLERIARDLLESRPDLTFDTVVTEAGSVVLARVAACRTPTRAAFSDDDTTYLRVNDRNVPLAQRGRGPTHLPGGSSLAERTAGLDGQVRGRFERTVRRSHTFSPLDYARRNNVSLRTARRDIRALREAFLVVETSPGIFEALEA